MLHDQFNPLRGSVTNSLKYNFELQIQVASCQVNEQQEVHRHRLHQRD
jgi:hypothetical protein